MKQIVFFLSILFYRAVFSQAVVNPRYQNSLWMVNISYKASQPLADLELRYGYMNGVGLDLNYKTKKNYLFSACYNFYFGRNIRDIDYIDIFKDSHGSVFTNEAIPVFVNASMRGSQMHVNLGKLFPVFPKKPQLALHFQLGAGFLQHKYLFSAPNSQQFSREYLKGYDRLSNGLSIVQTAGITHLGLRKRINFNLAFELTEAFTRNRRYYDYATMGTDTKSYMDIILSLKGSWILPITTRDKKAPVYFK